MVAGITPPWCNIKNVTHCKDGDNFWIGKGKRTKIALLRTIFVLGEEK